AGLTVIGDPDQAIYGFRGADVSLFLRFGEDFPAATTRQLTWNYRSRPALAAAAGQAIAPSSLVPGRVLPPAETGPAEAPGAPTGAERPTVAPSTTAALIGFHEAAGQR